MNAVQDAGNLPYSVEAAFDMILKFLLEQEDKTGHMGTLEAKLKKEGRTFYIQVAEGEE